MVDLWWIPCGSLVDPPIIFVDPTFRVVKNPRFLDIQATKCPDQLVPFIKLKGDTQSPSGRFGNSVILSAKTWLP